MYIPAATAEAEVCPESAHGNPSPDPGRHGLTRVPANLADHEDAAGTAACDNSQSGQRFAHLFAMLKARSNVFERVGGAELNADARLSLGTTG